MTSRQQSERIALEILSRSLNLPESECGGARLRHTPSWDSFAHVEIVVEIEERYDVRLTADQIEGVTSLQTLVDLLESCQ